MASGTPESRSQINEDYSKRQSEGVARRRKDEN